MDSKETETALQQLASDDGVVREKARKSLVATHSPEVIRALISELVDPRKQVRWEAAKALSEIGDPVAALGLVHAMDDDSKEVAWIAAEGVAAMGTAGLTAVLSGLTRSSRCPEFHKVAHHALKEFHKRGTNREIVETVMQALEGVEPRLTAPVVAYEALSKLRLAKTSA
ncbi:HEAT repeat domain-containing protein [Roseiconus nitratireducens]|uniref:HEAT repeat domain-containing protein n=1 Tax=Roseiconus nitratireducens TaxID=2605748 RepID=A0A5M6D684_9BACT|nr:HEAT repeat domain-containing protein [Roseiconus nitratireducens]KAA5543034.1 HEAT repeat domain-containing protein [Roseiconus nitratireducens]